mmetsp:Transcript_18864/g.38719  ORF Transcript_18864/g.38719 Transcript_18864/m.38719 type:complete len:293 (-) Transcript_18864:20-898(-)|eukprot:CAMPEP_0201126380 /NCGR_PEP_ID=MMETSP0850-20130426/25898_1 /ASSEMBLY_ACC=CAM_ASM_000622 /TAXON_ID=183588 /ORGANISM="Pseudo-nitzschia fraudulenta, Strain WWA7" /LENGTH=292 /DNA_ID=CAMNT_0047394795 /DNA_START=206 /DNA_END=1084 /DNA_ORIENTATION=-
MRAGHVPLSVSSKIFSVEWNQGVAAAQSRLLPSAAHFVFPDLPEVFSETDRDGFLESTEAHRRIHTVAACHHETAESLLKSLEGVSEPGQSSSRSRPKSKVLLVGGNHRGPDTLSSTDAARILQNETELTVWGVTNPNDPNSPERFERKVEAGMSGFITQPLLSSVASDTLQLYRDCTPTSKDVTILAGLAFPKTIKGLRFWAKLLDQEEELENDPLFQSHLAYFSQPYVTPMAWIGREMQDLLLASPPSSSGSNDDAGDPFVDGIHFMPLKNTEDLCTIFRSLNNNAHRSS